MKYIRLFENDTDYQSFIEGGVTPPAISYVANKNKAHYHPIPPPKAGDIVYKTGSAFRTIDYNLWDSSMGTPVGILVIPKGFAPDKKARMLSLHWASSSSTSSTSVSGIGWGGYGTDTSLTNYTRVPTTDNAGSTTTGANSSGFLPSDGQSGNVSYVDPLASYSSSTPYIPSPYLGDKPNPAYYAEISGYNNTLSDFNGKTNTDTLVALGTGYTAANAARNYKAAGAEEIEWYLPAMGELGYMIARWKEIVNGITKVNGSQLVFSNYWSSTEYDSYYTYGLDKARVYWYDKDFGYNVRPFAIIP